VEDRDPNHEGVGPGDAVGREARQGVMESAENPSSKNSFQVTGDENSTWDQRWKFYLRLDVGLTEGGEREGH